MPRKKMTNLGLEAQMYKGRENCSDPFVTAATTLRVANEQYRKGLRDGKKIAKRKKVKNN